MSEGSRIRQSKKLNSDEVAPKPQREPWGALELRWIFGVVLPEARGLGIDSPSWTSRQIQGAFREETDLGQGITLWLSRGSEWLSSAIWDLREPRSILYGDFFIPACKDSMHILNI